ncbi:DUF2339 domain-containing protein [Lachnobacterium bovis]|uniref:DUF2339 domain-containing protein n=1 Tax=Lachnobacterium bovis TaxID=140626 RepID=UPI0018658DE9|nr:DUF2339 domain-containing protein [Lachnobacterium bovis]
MSNNFDNSNTNGSIENSQNPGVSYNNGQLNQQQLNGMPNNGQMNNGPMYNGMPNNGQMNSGPMYNRMPNNGQMNSGPMYNGMPNMNFPNEQQKKSKPFESWLGTHGMIMAATVLIVISVILFGKIMLQGYEKIAYYSALYVCFSFMSLGGFYECKKNPDKALYLTVMSAGIISLCITVINTCRTFDFNFTQSLVVFAVWAVFAMILLYKHVIISLIITTIGTFLFVNNVILAKASTGKAIAIMLFVAGYSIFNIILNYKNKNHSLCMILDSLLLIYTYFCTSIFLIFASFARAKNSYVFTVYGIFGVMYILSLVECSKKETSSISYVASCITKIAFAIPLFCYVFSINDGRSLGSFLGLVSIIFVDDIFYKVKSIVNKDNCKNDDAYYICKIVSDIVIFLLFLLAVTIDLSHDTKSNIMMIVYYVVVTILSVEIVFTTDKCKRLKYLILMMFASVGVTYNLVRVLPNDKEFYYLAVGAICYVPLLLFVTMIIEKIRYKEDILIYRGCRYGLFVLSAISAYINTCNFFYEPSIFRVISRDSNKKYYLSVMIVLGVLYVLNNLLSSFNYYMTKKEKSKSICGVIRVIDYILYLSLVITTFKSNYGLKSYFTVVLIVLLLVDFIEIFIRKKLTSFMIGMNIIKVYTGCIGILLLYDTRGYIVSIVVFVVSVLYVFVGFTEKFRSKALRKTGLGMVLVCIFKMLIYDLRSGALIGYAIGFLVSGLLCVLISYIYNYFEKKYIDIYEKDKVVDEFIDNSGNNGRYNGPVPPPMPNGMNRGMNPGMMNPNGINRGMMNPNGMNPGMMNPNGINPGMMNPNGMNRGMMNPNGMNRGMMNPNGMNPGMMNPNGMNRGMMNPNGMNPGMMNPNGMNRGMMNPNGMNQNVSNQQEINNPYRRN